MRRKMESMALTVALAVSLLAMPVSAAEVLRDSDETEFETFDNNEKEVNEAFEEQEDEAFEEQEDEISADAYAGFPEEAAIEIPSQNAEDEAATVNEDSGEEDAEQASGEGTVEAEPAEDDIMLLITPEEEDEDVLVTGVSLNITKLTINTKDQTLQLTATVSPSDATDPSVTWSSSDTKVVTVDNNGKLTAVKDGTATITVTTTDGGYTAKCTVTVSLYSDGFHQDPDGTDWCWYKDGKISTGTTDIIQGTVNGTKGYWNVVKGRVEASATVAKGTVDGTNAWWYVNKKGMVDTSYTGFATNSSGSWYAENGKVTKKTNGVYKDTTGALGSSSDWYYILNSKVQFDFTGLADYKNASGWWYITNGKVDRSYNGLAKNKNGWYYLTNGKVDRSYTGFATNENGSWYIEKGKLERDENTVIKDINGALGSKSDWYYVVNSKVQSAFTGLANYKNASGWWYITNGKVDRTYNGLAKNKNGWYYLTNGKVDRSYTGFAKNENGSWYIEKGKLERDESTVIKDTNGALGSKSDWYYVVNSKVQYGFTGLASNSNGIWYITNGKVDRSYNGTYTSGKATYTIEKGKVTKKTGGYLICIDPGHQTNGNSAKEAIGPGSSTTKAKVSSGTRGVSTGLAEYQLNLTVSLKLRDELEARGYDVMMTRTTNDVNISNIERTTMANNANADILVHIHANGDSNSSVNGITVACPSASNPYVSNMYSADRTLASSILNNMVRTTGAKSMGLWITDEMTGLNWAKMPAVIVEMGFMTNPTEDQNMSKDSYQNKIVQGIADGIDEYFGSN